MADNRTGSVPIIYFHQLDTPGRKWNGPEYKVKKFKHYAILLFYKVHNIIKTRICISWLGSAAGNAQILKSCWPHGLQG